MAMPSAWLGHCKRRCAEVEPTSHPSCSEETMITEHIPPKESKLRPLTTLGLPLAIVIALVWLMGQPDKPQGAAQVEPQAAEQAPTREVQGKVVLVIVDALRPGNVYDQMPKLLALGRAPLGVIRPVRTCSANFTVPCVQTLLEGRQSPFVAGLQNFTGREGTSKSLPAEVKAAGLRQGMISDFTLETLYGRLAQSVINVEGTPGDHLHHDLEAIKTATRWLDAGSHDVIYLHLIGTDKASHRKRPGSPEYVRHFAQVDEALTALYQRLDPQRDHLLITGDHGHDQIGHHTRESLVIAQSPLLTPLLKQYPEQAKLEQTELTYLLSLAAQVPVSVDYEGRLLGLEQDKAVSSAPLQEALTRWSSAQQQRFSAAGFDGASLSAQRAQWSARQASLPWRTLWRTAPLLLLYLGWLLAMMWVERGAPLKRRTITGAVSAGALGLWFIGQWLPQGALIGISVMLAFALIYLCIKGPFKALKQTLPTLVMPLLVISVASAMGPRWGEVFHTRGGFKWTIVAFFVGGIALALATLLARPRHKRLTHLPTSLGALGLVGLPAGVYYYQVGQNITRGFILGGVITLLIWLVQRARKRHSASCEGRISWTKRAPWIFLLVISCAMTIWQGAGGWEWHAGLWRVLRVRSLGFNVALYTGLGALLVMTLKTWRARLVFASLWGISVLYSVGVAQLELSHMISGLATTVALASWLKLQDQEQRANVGALDAGLWMAALWICGCWFMLEGFFIGQVDFNFAFSFLKHLERERDVAALASVMTFFKHALPLWSMPFLLVGLVPSERAQRWTRWAFLALHLKLIALLMQIVIGPLGSAQKLYELALSEFLFVVSLGIIMLTGSVLATLLIPAAAQAQPSTARPSASE